MKTTTLMIVLLLRGAALSPALADEECTAWCGDGEVWSDEQGECVPVSSPQTS
jgi:hypothetical protein